MSDALHITGLKRGNQAPELVFSNLAINGNAPPSAIASVAIDVRRNGARIVRFASDGTGDYGITVDSATGFTVASHVPNYSEGTYRYQCKIVYASGNPFVFEGNWTVVSDDWTEAAV